MPVDEVDQVIVYRPEQCAACGALLLGYDPTPQRHQVPELPRVKATVTGFQAHSLSCPRCGRLNRGTLPRESAASQFGPNLVSLMAVLVQPSVAGPLSAEQAAGGRCAGHLF